MSCVSDGGITDEMERTYRSTNAVNDDDAIAEALRVFVCALGPAAAEVRIEFHAGAVTVAGVVASAVQRQGIEDLLLAHDGVESVVSELRVVADSGVIAL